MPMSGVYMTTTTPVEGKIYLVKPFSGRVWLFRSRFPCKGLTYHDACCCIYDNGNYEMSNRVYIEDGRICADSEVVYLREANRNEIAMFNSIIGSV